MKTKTLKDEVYEWLATKVSYGYTEIEALDEVTSHGCQAGCVAGLLFYKDTTAFYKVHCHEINALLGEFIADNGLSINELFGEKWDVEDPLALHAQNQNLLAFFGFEETAHRMLAEKAYTWPD